jgi:predicted alpha/beta-hydrolase family hydrolase
VDPETIFSPAAEPRALAVLAHGAGACMRSAFMEGIAAALPPLGIAVLRFDFPYMVAGRRAPDRPPVLLQTWRRARELGAAQAPGLPLVAGGRSMGGRIASMAVAEGMPADGLVFFSYPLHPPGKPEKLRDAHLSDVAVPMLFIQGTRDPFARPDLLAAVLARLDERAQLLSIEGGDHSLRTPGGPRDGAGIAARLAPAVAEFVGESII